MKKLPENTRFNASTHDLFIKIVNVSRENLVEIFFISGQEAKDFNDFFTSIN